VLAAFNQISGPPRTRIEVGRSGSFDRPLRSRLSCTRREENCGAAQNVMRDQAGTCRPVTNPRRRPVPLTAGAVTASAESDLGVGGKLPTSWSCYGGLVLMQWRSRLTGGRPQQQSIRQTRINCPRRATQVVKAC